MVKVVVPIIHEFGAHMHVPDLNLYYAFVHYYKAKVVDKYDHYITDRHGRKFKFWSKQGGLINPKTDQLAFEYNLHWQSDDKASKCFLAIKPLFGAGTKTKYGKTLNLPHIGVNIQVESSYFELHDILDIYEDVLNEIDAIRFEHEIDYQKSTIYQIAVHARYHEKHEADVVNMLRAIKDQSTMRGTSHLVEDFEEGKCGMYKIDIPSFDVCDIETKYKHSVKTYRIRNFLKRHPMDPLLHPKFEVYLNSSEQKRQPDGFPNLDKYLEVRKDLNNLLIKLLNFVGDDLVYVPDSYFSGSTTEHRGTPLKKWNYDKVADHPKLTLDDNSQNNAGLKLLYYLSLQREGSATLQDIVENTGIPERTVWRLLNHYKQEKLLESHRAKETIISFVHRGAWIAVKEAITILTNYLNLGYEKYCGYVVKMKAIRDYKDRHKNIQNDVVMQFDDSVIRCNSHQQANELQRDLKKAGLTRKISVISGAPRRAPQ